MLFKTPVNSAAIVVMFTISVDKEGLKMLMDVYKF